MEKFVLEEGQGSLWHEKNVRVVRKGKIKIEGVERYAAILEYTYPHSGDKKYELSISCGLLHLVPEDEKLKKNSPDMYGSLTFNEKAYKGSFWRNVKEDTGEEWTGVRISEKEDGQEVKQDGEKSPF